MLLFRGLRCTQQRTRGGVRALQSIASEDRLDALRSIPGYTPYSDFPTNTTVEDFNTDFSHLQPGDRLPDVDVCIAGRIVSGRAASSKLVFWDLISGGEKVQILASRRTYEGVTSTIESDETAPTDSQPSSEAQFTTMSKTLRRGDIIGIRGYPGKSKVGELSVVARQLVMLAPCQTPLPDQRHVLTDPEVRYRQRHLDLLVSANSDQGIANAVRSRAKMYRALRRVLDNRRYCEVETPLLWSSAGGAAAATFNTRSRALQLPLHLRIAPELFLKRLVVGGLDRVYELGKVFRNEGVDATHNPEFSMLELYEAYLGRDGMMSLTEQLLAEVCEEVHGGLLIPASDGGDPIDFTPPYRRLSIPTALRQRLQELQLPPPPDLNDTASIPALLEILESLPASLRPAPIPPALRTLPRLVDKLVGAVLEPTLRQPCFLTDHPISLSPLAKSHPADAPQELSGCTQRFELFVCGRELANGYAELNDPEQQQQRFQDQLQERLGGDDEAPLPDEGFVQALRAGLPPTAGAGIGLDRLLMLLVQQPHIRDVLLFPLMKDRQPTPDDDADADAAAAAAAAGSTDAAGAVEEGDGDAKRA